MLAKMFSKFELNKVWKKVRQMSLDNLQASKTFFFPSDVKEVWKECGSALGRTPFTTTTTLRQGESERTNGGTSKTSRGDAISDALSAAALPRGFLIKLFHCIRFPFRKSAPTKLSLFLELCYKTRHITFPNFNLPCYVKFENRQARKS